MRIIITKSGLSTYWYANRIGEKFLVGKPVYDELLKEMVVWPDVGEGCIVLDDCEEV